MTQAQALRIEATDRRHSFALNYARNQFGNRVFRNLAALIADGHDVVVASFDDGAGFILDDGIYRDWKEFAK